MPLLAGLRAKGREKKEENLCDFYLWPSLKGVTESRQGIALFFLISKILLHPRCGHFHCHIYQSDTGR
jgi:hypothetical protein